MPIKIMFEMPDGWRPGNCSELVDQGIIRTCPIRCEYEGTITPERCPLWKYKEVVEVKATSGLGVLYDEMDCTDGFEVDGVRKTIWMEK